jgi:hypothetical protein
LEVLLRPDVRRTVPGDRDGRSCRSIVPGDAPTRPGGAKVILSQARKRAIDTADMFAARNARMQSARVAIEKMARATWAARAEHWVSPEDRFCISPLTRMGG